MLFERIMLQENNENAWIDTYVADKVGEFKRSAILVIPGGGYAKVCSTREGEPIAFAFMPHGFNAFVLHYSIGANAKFPQPLIEASLAVKHIKDNAEKYGIDAEKVFVTGFSAGGHLCASLGTLWHLKEIYDVIQMPFGYNKPKAIVPVYPVISSDPEISHTGSFDNLIGNAENETEREKYSLELCVDERTAPAFIVHTANDTCVNVKNSIRYADALSSNNIPFELHIFSDAPHGMALSNELTARGNPKLNNPHNAKWVELAAEWVKTL